MYPGYILYKRIGIFTTILISLLILVSAGCSRGPSDKDLGRTMGYASADSVVTHVFELADPKYEGRPTGLQSMLDASAYIRDKMISYNLRPGASDTSYFQWFDVDYNQIAGPAALRASIGGRTKNFNLLEDFIPSSISGSGRFTDKPLVIVDSSVSISDLKVIRGMAAIYVPPAVLPEPDTAISAYDRRGMPRRHILEMAAQFVQAGTAALIVPGGTSGTISSYGVEGMPIYQVTPEVIDRLLGNRTQSALRRGIRRIRGVTLSGEVATIFHSNAATVNVIGVLQGADESLRNEYVIVGAHADHVGTIAGHVHYGAHDNASGIAVMLETARLTATLAESGFSPKRSILFIAFTGEEMGLLGSRYYVEREPVRPLGSTVAMLNLDIVGGGTGYMAVGGENFPGFFNLIRSINEEYIGAELLKRPNAPNSDHYFFAEEGIPSVFLYALTGPPIGIHTPTDTADKMDPDFMQQTARFAFRIVWELANHDDPASLR